ncbi:MAG TPA: hypothetical protein VFK88_02630 [Gallionella sp.]|nr:hypothetical protein [Gallionella sp.]
MRFISLVFGILALLPSLATAIPVFNVNSVSCSGNLTPSFASMALLDCTGNLSLDEGSLGGTLTADTQVILSALGSLSLANLYFSAPKVMLSGSSVSLGPGAMVNATTSLSVDTANGGLSAFNTAPGATLTIGNNGNALGNPSFLSIPNVTFTTSLSANPLPGSGSVALVPEPSVFETMLLGVLVLAGFAGLNRLKQGGQTGLARG